MTTAVARMSSKLEQKRTTEKCKAMGSSMKVAPPEKQNGSVEYKRQVSVSVSDTRVRTLATQMSYRLDEGRGRCTYMIGVEDDGCHSLLDYKTVSESARMLECIARTLNSIVISRKIIENEETEYFEPSIFPPHNDHNNNDHNNNHNNNNSDEKKEDSNNNNSEAKNVRCELVIQRVETHSLDSSPLSFQDIATASQTGGKSLSPSASGEERIMQTLSQRNIRVAVVGNVDAGKSTLIGTLTTSSLDDGRGCSRTAIMKHRHEIESGRTSTASTHLMGFTADGEPIKPARKHHTLVDNEIAKGANRIITLMDLAGHEKYLKTTIHGVSSGMADYALILVNSRHPPTHMTQHHLNLCCSYGIPVIVIFTKIDGCPEHAMKTSKQELNRLLRSPDIGKKPFVITKESDIETVIGKLSTGLTPILDTSCVTGQGLDLLRKILWQLPKRRKHFESKVHRPFEFLVEDVFFNVPGVAGSVVSGFVNAGELSISNHSSNKLYIGPMDDGSFLPTVAKSAHMARINTTHITSGQSACLALSIKKEEKKLLRKGMVVLAESPTCTKTFDADICVLKGEGTTIRHSYQAYVHILHVRQSAHAKHIELITSKTHSTSHHHYSSQEEDGTIVLRPGSRAKVRFEFAKRPEYIRPGMRMLFRDGRVRGVGIITAVHDNHDSDASTSPKSKHHPK